MTQEEIAERARVLWDYHHLNHPLRSCQVMLVLGSHDLRVADYAARLYLENLASTLVFTGGFGNLTEGVWERPEADLFAERAHVRGVPERAILRENRATNTGENIRFSRDLLREKGIVADRYLLVQKPYMERRAYATFRKQWPGPECLVTSPPISFEEYPTDEIPFEKVVHLLVGDLQRIHLYAEKGFQIPQEIPDTVWEAFHELVDAGFTEHLIQPIGIDTGQQGERSPKGGGSNW